MSDHCENVLLLEKIHVHGDGRASLTTRTPLCYWVYTPYLIRLSVCPK